MAKAKVDEKVDITSGVACNCDPADVTSHTNNLGDRVQAQYQCCNCGCGWTVEFMAKVEPAKAEKPKHAAVPDSEKPARG